MSTAAAAEFYDQERDDMGDVIHLRRPAADGEQPAPAGAAVPAARPAPVLPRDTTQATAPAGPDSDDHGPVLPEWLASRAALVGTARMVRRRALYLAGFHGLRSPVYVLRWSARAAIGAVRMVRMAWTWAFDLEARMMRRTLIEAGQAAEYRALRAQHHHRVKVRLWSSAVTGTAFAAGLAVGESYSRLTLPGVGVAALAALGYAGRPVEGGKILDTPDIPVSVNLTGEHLNSAFRAAGLLDKDARLVVVQPIMRDRLDIGFTAVIDLPRGGGKTAAQVLAKRDVLAAELGIDEVQLQLWRIRAGQGGHAARIGVWVADDDPYIGGKVASPLADLDAFSMWDAIPFGANARGTRVSISLLWHAIFIGGLPRRGKSFAQRLLAAAAVLDAHARVYCADGKGGRDWKAVSRVAHRYIAGAEAPALKAFMAMLKELIGEMERRFAVINGLPDSICPEGKLTPEIARKYDMPPVLILIDELQEYLSSLDGKTEAPEAVEMLCRLARRAPAAGFVLCVASQRPDADSVPTKLREIIDYRFSVQCKDTASSDMVLGKGMASIGANAALLSADHLGVGVLVTGPADFETVRTDYMDLPTFAVVCERGRAARTAAKTLTGDAAGQLADLAHPETVIPAILTDCLSVMRHAPTMHTTTLLTGLAALDDDRWGDLTDVTLAKALEDAGVVRSTKQVKVNTVNLAGYRRADLEAALPASATPPRLALADDGGPAA